MFSSSGVAKSLSRKDELFNDLIEECASRVSGSELLGKPVSEVLEWLFPLYDDLTQLLCKRDDVATVF